MALLSRVCCAVLALSLMASVVQAAPGRRVSTTVYGTSYYEVPTFGGVDAADIDVRSPYRALPGGRVAHSVHGGMTISAGKIKTPWYARFGWTKSQVQGALRTGLKGIKKGGWGIIIGFGLEAILKRAGWFEDSGQYYVLDGDFKPGRYHWSVYGQLNRFNPPVLVDEDTSNPLATCAMHGLPYIDPPDVVGKLKTNFPDELPKAWHCRFGVGEEGALVRLKGDCGLGKVWEAGQCKYPDDADGRRPVNASDIDKLDLSDYQPTDKAADWDGLKRNLGTPSWQEYDPLPSHHGEPQTTVHPDGSTTTTQTDYQPYISPPDGSYTTSPTVHTRERTTTTRYRDGKKTDEKTEDKDSGKDDKGDNKGDPKDDGKGDPKDDGKGDPKDDGKGDPKDDGKGDPKDDGKGDGKTDPKNQQLRDCKLMPTLCKWMEWTREEAPEEPDLRPLAPQEIKAEKNITIRFGAKRCPSPTTVTFGFFGTHTYQIDYEPFCDLAAKMYYFIVAFAYVLAARILIGGVRD